MSELLHWVMGLDQRKTKSEATSAEVRMLRILFKQFYQPLSNIFESTQLQMKSFELGKLRLQLARDLCLLEPVSQDIENKSEDLHVNKGRDGK